MLHYSDIEISEKNKIIIVIAGFLIGVLLIELIIGGYYETKKKQIYEDCYRVSENGATLQPFIDHIKEQRQTGEKILVILGGSTSYGSSSEHTETVSCYLSKKFKRVKVYNLATDANRPTDDYLVFKAINGYADYVIINAFYGWFYFPSKGSNAKYFVAHPEYTFLDGVTDDDSSEMDALPHSARKFEYPLDSLAENLKIYQNRQLIQQEFIGNTPEEKPRALLRLLQCKAFNRCNLPRYTSFIDKDIFTRQVITDAPELRNASIANMNEVPLKYWIKIADESNAQTLVYFNPINPVVTAYLENTNYSSNVNMTKTTLTSFSKIEVVDLAASVSSLTPADFTDASHTLSSGNEKIGEELYQVIKNEFEGIE